MIKRIILELAEFSRRTGELEAQQTDRVFIEKHGKRSNFTAGKVSLLKNLYKTYFSKNPDLTYSTWDESSLLIKSSIVETMRKAPDNSFQDGYFEKCWGAK